MNKVDSPMRFKDNGDGTVTNLNTGLMWQQQDDDVPRTWQEAVDYSKSLSLSGHKDWRLPTIDELKTLVDIEHRPTIDPIFIGTKRLSYWSSTTDAYDASYAWHVNFYYGNVGNYNKTFGYYVRCVRLGEPVK